MSDKRFTVEITVSQWNEDKLTIIHDNTDSITLSGFLTENEAWKALYRIEKQRKILKAILDVTELGEQSTECFFGSDFEGPFQQARDLLEEVSEEADHGS